MRKGRLNTKPSKYAIVLPGLAFLGA
ncbi:MAG: hypothetical protein RL102_1084, partial [Actinomycetota bacterium]